MILSDREIQAALRRRTIRITPPPPELESDAGRATASPWSSTTLALHLDQELTVWTAPAGGAHVYFPPPDDPAFDFEALLGIYARRFNIPADGHPLQPGDFVLGWTLERVQLPVTSRLAARVEGKSSLARIGIGVHVTAPIIHAGFGVKSDDDEYPGSQIRLEIFHHGQFPLLLKVGMKVCQLVFEEVHGTPVKGYQGQFAVQGAQPLPPI